MKYYKKDLKVLALEYRDINNPSTTEFEKLFSTDGWEEIPFDYYQEMLIRHTGRSTRLVDQYIQELFNKGEVIVTDHHNTRMADEFTFKTMINRLKSEHLHLFENNKIKLKHDKRGFTISLK